MGVLEDRIEVLRAREPRRGWILPLSIVVAFAVVAAIWLAYRESEVQSIPKWFDSPALGCRFQYPTGWISGPNFVRSPRGAILTVERHSLFEAKRDWVAALPDVLYPQVLIQLDQGYRELREISRSHGEIAGRESLQVVHEGFAGAGRLAAVVTVDIFASEQWVYVLRLYSPRETSARDAEAFERLRRSFTLLP